MAEDSGGKNILEGMTNKAAKASDASTKPQPESINSDSVRSSVGSGSKTLGPRTA